MTLPYFDPKDEAVNWKLMEYFDGWLKVEGRFGIL